MTKWEYTMIQTCGFRESDMITLRQMGEQGWELAATITFGDPSLQPNVYYTFFFKRSMPGGISPDEIRAAKDCLRRAGIIDMPEEAPA